MNRVHTVCTSCTQTKNGNGFNIVLKAFTNRTTQDAWGTVNESFVLTYYMWRRTSIPVVQGYNKEMETALLEEHRKMVQDGITSDKFVEVDLDDYHMEEIVWVIPEGQANAGEERKLKHIVHNDIYDKSKAKDAVKE